MVILPLPGTVTASIVSSSPPTSVQARPGDHADLVLELGLAVAVLAHAGIVVEVLARRSSTVFFSPPTISLTDLRARLAISRSSERTPASRV